jgi:hypothetical protein
MTWRALSIIPYKLVPSQGPMSRASVSLGVRSVAMGGHGIPIDHPLVGGLMDSDRHVISRFSSPSFLESSGILTGLMDSARNVIRRVLNPRLMSEGHPMTWRAVSISPHPLAGVGHRMGKVVQTLAEAGSNR